MLPYDKWECYNDLISLGIAMCLGFLPDEPDPNGSPQE